VLRNQMTPLIIDSRVVLFRNILTPDHSVRVRVRGQFISGVKIFRDTGFGLEGKGRYGSFHS